MAVFTENLSLYVPPVNAAGMGLDLDLAPL